MEKNRIYYAAFGCILIIIFSVSITVAQEASDDSLYIIEPGDSLSDTSGAETHADSVEQVTKGIFEKEKSDSLYERADTSISGEPPDTVGIVREEILHPTAYYRRNYLSRGVGDELKNKPGIFMYSAGPMGSPHIPLHYLNVPGIEIYLNDHPFLYNDIYRPYKIGGDLNAVPWEILNEIYWDDKHSLDNRIHFDLGRPPDDENRSDVELARGPYGYSPSRWRFFRPFGTKTYGYFTVGFKKSNGYLQNSACDGYHVTGGGSRVVYNGLLTINLWKYRAKSGVSSFDYLTAQTFRHSRTTHRYEVSYSKEIERYFDFKLSGVYQKNGLIAKDLADTISIDGEIAGGKASIGKNFTNNNIDLGMSYYKLRVYKLAGVKPSVNLFEYSGKLSGNLRDFNYKFDMIYSWNGVDHGTFLPSAYAAYEIKSILTPFVSFSRSRRLPDLNLMYFDDYIVGLGATGILESYRFGPSRRLRFPVTSEFKVGTETDLDWSSWRVAASFIKIKDQIYLSYQGDTAGAITVTPTNFDDELLELSGSMNFRYGLFDGELGGEFRKWDERYFSDGLEKGPAFIGFGRLSALKSFFFDDLFLGGSLEFRGASRQDYRSIRPSFLDWFGVLNGRLEFHYKDFIFWWNEDNLTNNNYTTWWPYPQKPRTLWWGFRWRFYD